MNDDRTAPTRGDSPAPQPRRRLARFAALFAGGAALMLAACTFTNLHGISQLHQEAATGIFDTSSDRHRIYVGVIDGGDRWNAAARISAVDPVTGQTLYTVAAPAPYYRAVAVDRADDTVWLLRDDGTLEHRNDHLGLGSSEAGYFSAPADGTLRRFCDLESAPGGHFLATGLYQVNGQLRGFLTHVQPASGQPSGRASTWESWPLPSGVDVGPSCPRVSYDTDTNRALVLMPSAGGMTPEGVYHRVARYKRVPAGSRPAQYDLVKDATFTHGEDAKFLPGDITARSGYYAVAYQYLSDLSSDRIDLRDQSGGYHDGFYLKRARALDVSSYAPLGADPSAVLWWTGNEDTTGLSYDVGVIGLAE